MFRFVAALCGLGVLAGAVYGQEQTDVCQEWSSDVLSADSWTAEIQPGSYSDTLLVEVQIRNLEKVGIRMAKGLVVFQDALERRIASIGLDEDLTVASGQTTSQTGNYHLSSQNARLAKIDPNDVSVHICVGGVVSETGKVISYDTSK